MAENMPPRASLLGLPAEIRQTIFGYVMFDEGERSETDRENRWLTENLEDLVFVHFFENKPPQLMKWSKKWPDHRLLLTSRQCRQEAMPMLYKKEGFYLFNDYDWAMWWKTMAAKPSSTFELHNTKHPLPDMFGYIRELAFQPMEDVSEESVQSIERTFPALHTLRAFRHIYLQDRIGALEGVLPLICREFHRLLLLAAIVVTKKHSKLRHAKWSDWRFFPNEEPNSIRTMTMKFTSDSVLLKDEDGLLDVEKVSKLPLSDFDAWKELVETKKPSVAEYCKEWREVVETKESDIPRTRPTKIRASPMNWPRADNAGS